MGLFASNAKVQALIYRRLNVNLALCGAYKRTRWLGIAGGSESVTNQFVNNGSVRRSRRAGVGRLFLFAICSGILRVMKTTKADFELFKKYCNEAVQKLGLVEWSLYYDRDNLEDAYARTYWKLAAGAATIVLATYWDDLRPKTDEEIRRLAYHEVMHVLMAPLLAEAEDRYTNQSAIDIAEHQIIRRLENILI